MKNLLHNLLHFYGKQMTIKDGYGNVLLDNELKKPLFLLRR